MVLAHTSTNVIKGALLLILNKVTVQPPTTAVKNKTSNFADRCRNVNEAKCALSDATK